MHADDNASAHQPPDVSAGVPIYDRNGEQLGVVSADGVQEPYLMMTEGHLLHREVAVPISAIERSDAQGVYLNQTKQEIHDLTLGGWSSLGDVDLDTGMPAAGPAEGKEYRDASFPDGNNAAGMLSATGVPASGVASAPGVSAAQGADGEADDEAGGEQAEP